MSDIDLSAVDLNDEGNAVRSNRLLTIAQATAALSIGKTKLYELFATGELAWVQIGAHRRVAQSEIDRFIADHTARAAVPA